MRAWAGKSSSLPPIRCGSMPLARTGRRLRGRLPSISLAKDGINYTRCHAQNVVCMPARSTMMTGQYVSTHGVWMNGVSLPADAPSVARYLKDRKNYKTALIGKAHFEPFLDISAYENRMAMLHEFGPHRGFDHMELGRAWSAGVAALSALPDGEPSRGAGFLLSGAQPCHDGAKLFRRGRYGCGAGEAQQGFARTLSYRLGGAAHACLSGFAFAG